MKVKISSRQNPENFKVVNLKITNPEALFFSKVADLALAEFPLMFEYGKCEEYDFAPKARAHCMFVYFKRLAVECQLESQFPEFFTYCSFLASAKETIAETKPIETYADVLKFYEKTFLDVKHPLRVSDFFLDSSTVLEYPKPKRNRQKDMNPFPGI